MSRLSVTFRRTWARLIESRAITSLPWVSGGPRDASLVTSERAVMLIPLFASVRILADSIASLPIQLYRRGFGTREPITFVPQLFFQPAARDNLFQWLHKCVVSLALRGNAYGLVTLRDNLDFPIMIEWLNPDEIWVDDSRPTMPVYYWLGNEVPREDIVHIPWVAMPGRVKGLSPVAAFAQTIGVGLAVTDYGKSWYDNGGTPPATMKNSAKTINPQESREIQGRLSAAMRSRKPLVFGSDWDFTALQVSPEESQFIETMKLNATQIAAIWGIPPEMVGGDQGGPLSYSSPEQNMIHLVSVTLRPWLVRLETVFSDLMPGREFVKFNVDAMIRTSLLDRYTAHGMALAQGWRNVDEIRAIEDLPPLPNGQGAGYGSAALPAPAPPNNDNSA